MSCIISATYYLPTFLALDDSYLLCSFFTHHMFYHFLWSIIWWTNCSTYCSLIWPTNWSVVCSILSSIHLQISCLIMNGIVTLHLIEMTMSRAIILLSTLLLISLKIDISWFFLCFLVISLLIRSDIILQVIFEILLVNIFLILSSLACGCIIYLGYCFGRRFSWYHFDPYWHFDSLYLLLRFLWIPLIIHYELWFLSAALSTCEETVFTFDAGKNRGCNLFHRNVACNIDTSFFILAPLVTLCPLQLGWLLKLSLFVWME